MDPSSQPDRLKAYLHRWQLEDPQLVAETMTSRVYQVKAGQETAMLKLLSAGESEEQRGAAALRHFDGRGAVALLRWDDRAQLLEHASGEELITLVEHGEDERATAIIADVISQLHSAPGRIPAAGFVSLDRWFEALLKRGAADRSDGIDSFYARSAPVAARLLAEKGDARVLHGDIHHRNIRRSARGWLSFDPKGLVGERAYDCANTLCNPPIPAIAHNERRLLSAAEILSEKLAIDRHRILAFAYSYACLNACWWSALTMRTEWQEMVRWHLKVAAIIEPHIVL